MLKNFFTKRLIMCSACLFALFLMYIIPNNEDKIDLYESVHYVSDVKQSKIFLLDENNYLALTKVMINDSDKVILARELLEILIKDGVGESKIPNGFKSLIPSDTEILSIEYNDSLIKVNFSNKLLDVKMEYEEKIIEAIVYTLTSIEGIDKVIIYIDGDIVSKLPKTGKILPSTLDRSYGINKDYEIESYKNISGVTVYYVSKYNESTYYVPVTKYVNDSREKIKIIIDELSSSPLYKTNLMSYLNSNIILLASEQDINTMFLNFNNYLFSDINSKNILEEVIYCISLSIFDNYDVEEVVFEVDEEEIYKSALKSIE